MHCPACSEKGNPIHLNSYSWQCPSCDGVSTPFEWINEGRGDESEEDSVMPRMEKGEICHLIGEFMNLLDACRMKGVVFEAVDGIDLNNSAELINASLRQLGYSDAFIAGLWTGEEQFS